MHHLDTSTKHVRRSAWAGMPNDPIRLIRLKQTSSLGLLWCSILSQIAEGDCNYGTWWSLWGNLGVTTVCRDAADSNARPVNAVWWIVCARSGFRRVHVHVCVRHRERRCVFLCPPGEPPRPDGVSDGTLITQPSKRAVLGRSDWKGDGCVVVREVAFGGKQSRAGGGGGGGRVWSFLWATQVSHRAAALMEPSEASSLSSLPVCWHDWLI